MVQIISKFNSSIPSVRKVKGWIQNDPYHIWHGRDRLVLFFILSGDDAANAFMPLEEVDFSGQDENIRAILESTHQEELERRKYYQQVYFKLFKLLDTLDDLNIQLTSIPEDDIDEYAQVDTQIQLLHTKLLDFINDVFVWRDHKEMGELLGEIRSGLDT